MEKDLLLIVSIGGGLGNQMFQYAFGKVLELKFGKKILYDTSFFESEDNEPIENTDKNKHGFYIRKCGLNVFKNASLPLATKEQIETCIDFKGRRRNPLPGFLRKIFKLKKYKEFSNKITQETYCEFNEKYFNTEKNFYYLGYWQNEKYFAGFENELRHCFELPEFPQEDSFNQTWLKKIKSCENSVFIHLRHGDYPEGAVLPVEYYKKAVKLIKEKVSDPKFFIFGCNCKDFVENELNINAPFEFIGDNNHKTEGADWKDLKLMSECRHAIVANSTFSWWAAWLSDNKDKITVAPSPWLFERDDTICSNWYKIKIKEKNG